ncbi:hypothetical protein LPTSP3_g21970 [Leptospira kobayashii]|uniref:LysM domain-containing protein n=2 Tax=Leptospira kobayashii TaxID=1917830 RepID=A0ABM7UK80_9LEPT|nr:hypothetical protein LPTSP3_g21970 [Leptospira kobayashii]
MVNKMTRYILILCLILFSQTQFLTADEEPKLEPITITVQKGENLSLISKKYLEDSNRWSELLKYNKIPNPNLIKPGMTLTIPVFLRKPVMGVASFVVGKVEWNGAGGSGPWTPVKLGQELHAKDQIKTSDKGKVDIQIREVGLIRVFHDSLFEVKGKETPNSAVSVALFKGSLDAKVNKSANKQGDYKLTIVNPSATAGVRGTEFRVELDSKLNSTTSCFEGIVDVNAEGKTVTVTQGMATFVEKGKAPVEPYLIPEAPKLKAE